MPKRVTFHFQRDMGEASKIAEVALEQKNTCFGGSSQANTEKLKDRLQTR